MIVMVGDAELRFSLPRLPLKRCHLSTESKPLLDVLGNLHVHHGCLPASMAANGFVQSGSWFPRWWINTQLVCTVEALHWDMILCGEVPLVCLGFPHTFVTVEWCKKKKKSFLLLWFGAYCEAEDMAKIKGMLQAPQEVLDCPSPKWARWLLQWCWSTPH